MPVPDQVDLDEFFAECLESLRKRSGRRSRVKSPARISLDYTSRLQDRATFRRLLADSRLDALRFQFWFSRVDTRLSLDGWRQRIDEKIAVAVKEES